MRYWIEMSFFLHLVFCIISLYELIAETKLAGKGRFAILIMLVPIVGILQFEKARKRSVE